MSVRHDVFAAIGLGVLTGLLVGLSVSAVVGTVLGAVIALAVTWSACKEVASDTTGANARYQIRQTIALRVGSFTTACALALLVGLWLRTSSALSPSLTDRRDAWVTLGFSKENANSIMVLTALSAIDNPSDLEKAHRTALFVDPVITSQALKKPGTLNLKRLQNFTSMTKVLDALENTHSPAWMGLAKGIKDWSESDQKVAIKSIAILFSEHTP